MKSPESARMYDFLNIPEHTQHWRCKECGTDLLKKVKTSAGTTVLRPRQVYCYNNVVNSLNSCYVQIFKINVRNGVPSREIHLQCVMFTMAEYGSVWTMYPSCHYRTTLHLA